ncbi:MAG: hypothetical protein IT299_02980 [Dehalococcoidia bacterium]|nr:hypothetical protein [Dehalococcoidia bacterium]
MARLLTSPLRAPRALPALNRWHWLATGTLLLTIGLPLGVALTGGLASMWQAATVPDIEVITRAASGTIAAALTSTLIGIAVGLPLADLLGTLRGNTGRVLRFVPWLPLAVPPLVYALGVRRVIEMVGLADTLRDPASATLALLPVVLAQSSIAIAVTVAALFTCRQPSDSRRTRGRGAGEDVARVLGAPLLLRSWLADPAGTRTGLLVAGCLGLIHGLTSVAAALVFPASASLSLGATLLRGGVPAAALVAWAPLLLTLALLLVARHLASTVEPAPALGPPEATGRARSTGSATAVAAGVVLLTAVLPPAAVLLTGLGPVAVGTVILNAPGVPFIELATTSLAMLGAAVLGALLPLVLSVPEVLEHARRASLPWVALVVPCVALVLGGATLGLPVLVAALLVHLVIGFAAALPVFHARWNGTSRGSLDAARVLGASTLQALWWEDREAFIRFLGAALAAGVIASLGDVAAGATAAAGSVGLGSATVAFLAAPEAERGAFAFGAVLALAGVAALLALEAGRAATAPMWWRR